MDVNCERHGDHPAVLGTTMTLVHRDWQTTGILSLCGNRRIPLSHVLAVNQGLG